MYLGEGLFRYIEHSLTRDSIRRDKETLLRHIKNWLFPGGNLSFFNLASFPILFYHVDLYEPWIRGDFLARCLSSSMWIKLPGLIEVCLESCSIDRSISLLLLASVLDSQEIPSASWPVTVCIYSLEWPWFWLTWVLRLPGTWSKLHLGPLWSPRSPSPDIPCCHLWSPLSPLLCLPWLVA